MNKDYERAFRPVVKVNIGAILQQATYLQNILTLIQLFKYNFSSIHTTFTTRSNEATPL